MSSWDDLFVVLNEAKKNNKQKNNSNDLTLGDIESELDPNGEKANTDEPAKDDFGENEFENDLPTDSPDTSKNPMADPDEMDIDGLDDDLDMDGDDDDLDTGDLEDPDGFDGLDDELNELQPEDKEKKAYMFKLLTRTINIAEKLLDEFVPINGIKQVKKEFEQLNKIIELLTYYKKYKFDALTDFDELESIIKKSIKTVDKLSKRLIRSNTKNRSGKNKK